MAAAVDGYNRAQGGEDEPEELSFDEFDRMLDRNAEFLIA